MSRNAVLIWLSLAAASMPLGCGPDTHEECVSQCTSCANKCTSPGGKCSAPTEEQCDEECTVAERVADNDGCSSEYDDLIECIQGSSDVCHAEDTDCNDKSNTLESCLPRPPA